MYENRVIAFVDILGFSNAIKKTMNQKKEDKNETNRINSLLTIIQKDFFIKNDFISDEKKEAILGTRIAHQFSDSLIVSFKINEESGIFFILLDILFLIMTALQHGFLLRGAIVKNQVYHTKDKIFGPGLVEAYEMEKSMAIYPRIIVSDEVLKLSRKYHASHHDPDLEESYVRQIVNKDFDGMNYINYFTGVEDQLDAGYDELYLYYNKLREEIIKLDTGDINLKAKYNWLREKYNNGLSEYRNIFNNKESKEAYPEISSYFRSMKMLK